MSLDSLCGGWITNFSSVFTMFFALVIFMLCQEYGMVVLFFFPLPVSLAVNGQSETGKYIFTNKKIEADSHKFVTSTILKTSPLKTP